MKFLRKVLHLKKYPEKIVIIFDGPQFYHIQKRLGRIELSKIKNFFDSSSKDKVVEMVYCDSAFKLPTEKEIEEFSPDETKRILKICNARENRHRILKQLGAEIVIPSKKGKDNNDKSWDIDTDVKVVSQIIRAALDSSLNEIVLVSGDEDFADFLEFAKKIRKNLRITILSGKEELSVEGKLKKSADKILYIEDIIKNAEEPVTSGD